MQDYTLYRSEKDIRPLIPVDFDTNWFAFALINPAAPFGPDKIVKRFANESDREDYLTRNGYVGVA